MQYEIDVGGRLRRVAVRRQGEVFEVTVDGVTRRAQAVRIDAHTLSLLVDGTRSYEATVDGASCATELSVAVAGTVVQAVVDARRRLRAGDDPSSAGGTHRVAAPMPGKVVRVLVRVGDIVRARQPVVVVEAMKMESELRAAGDGTVTEVHAREGALVDAGAALVVIASGSSGDAARRSP